MFSMRFSVERLICLLIDVVEDIFFDQLVEAGILPLITLRVILRLGWLNRVLFCDRDRALLTVISHISGIVLINQDLALLKSVTSSLWKSLISANLFANLCSYSWVQFIAVLHLRRVEDPSTLALLTTVIISFNRWLPISTFSIWIYFRNVSLISGKEIWSLPSRASCFANSRLLSTKQTVINLINEWLRGKSRSWRIYRSNCRHWLSCVKLLCSIHHVSVLLRFTHLVKVKSLLV